MTGPILVLGATSGIGAEVVTAAAARGLEVRAFARSADKLESRAHVTAFPGDARDAEAVGKAVEGACAVVYALGIRERLSMLWQDETLFSESTRILINAMKAKGAKRLVAVTGFGAGRSKSAMSSVERLGHRALLGRPYADKDRQEALIMGSDLDWTIARPVILTNGAATGRYRVLHDPKEWRNGLISRKDVAEYIVSAIADERDIRKDVVLAR